MFSDIPAGNAAIRVAIAAGADLASNASLNTVGQSSTDRVVGFAGAYPDVTVPMGPIVQVRRDDSYRFLGGSFTGTEKFQYRCAYYITTDTPPQPSGANPNTIVPKLFAAVQDESGSPDAPPDSQPEPIGDPVPDSSNISEADVEQAAEGYENLMNDNLTDNIEVGGVAWGGEIAAPIALNATDDGPEALESASGSILEILAEAKEEAKEEAAKGEAAASN